MIIPLTIGPVTFDVEFYIVDLEPNFNFLLGRPWLHKHQVIPSTLHYMIKFRHDDDVIVVMAENFEKERIEAVAPISSHTIPFDPKLSAALYRVNWCESVSFVPDLEHVNCLAIHSNPFRMVENVCYRWGYVKGTPLGRYGQGIAEPIRAAE